MKYRTEIDGLRALAVLPVLFFHARFPFFQGGYVGVDIFFVISGFLITSVILDDVEKGKFSLVRFYERRARRILPALFTVFIFCLFASWLILFPKELKHFGASLATSSLFVSNLYFMMLKGYFVPVMEKNPLIHIWSLSVEEQFYLLYPLLFILLCRLGNTHRVLIISGGIILSLILSLYCVRHFPDGNFFSSPSRAWELLMGGLTAVTAPQENGKKSFLRNALSLSGLVLICLSVTMFDRWTPWPSLFSLTPTLGTVLILAFGKDTWVSRILSLPFFVFIGLISYSLYLWHQPLFAFTEAYLSKRPSDTGYLLLMALSILLAYLSWRFVEKPFRTPGILSRVFVFKFSIVGLVFFSFCGGILYLKKGFWGRFNPQVQEQLKVADDLDKLSARLFDKSGFVPERDGFRMGDRSKAPTVCLWGDSHAAALSSSTDRLLAKKGIGGIFFGRGACPPILGVIRTDNPEGYYFPTFNEKVMEYILGSKDISTVILVSRWSINIEGNRLDNGESPMEEETARLIPQKSFSTEEERKKIITDQIKITIQKLMDAHKMVILVYPIPELGFNVPEANARAIMNDSPAVSMGYPFYLKRNRYILGFFDSLPQFPYLQKVFPDKVFCSDGRCWSKLNNATFYADDNHLSDAGADLLTLEIGKYF